MNKIKEQVKNINETFRWDGWGELADFILQTRPELAKEIISRGYSVGQIAEKVWMEASYN